MSSEVIFQLSAIHRSFKQGSTELNVLKGAELSIKKGEIVALVGPSGAGKSTLLHIAGLLEKPDSGEVRINGEVCCCLGEEDRTSLRRNKLGFVYQFHHLLPEFSAVENVVIPQMINGMSRKKALERALFLIEALGLKPRAHHRPGQLSGGEQQRIALARALANEPAILLADEPTGNLDPDTADGVFSQLLVLARDHGLTALIATHNQALTDRMDRTVRLAHGILTSD